MPEKLVIGLGNPGDEYERTRHNIGFMAVDAIAEKNGGSAWKKKFKGLISTSGNNILLKPQTFMNLSGESAREALSFYQLSAEDVIVFHDDLDLAPGHIRIKKGGGSGGHNGLKSLDTHIGQDYWRVRIGIGRPMREDADGEAPAKPVKGDAVSGYVLSPFAKKDKIWVEPLVAAIADGFGLLVKGDRESYLENIAKSAHLGK